MTVYLLSLYYLWLQVVRELQRTQCRIPPKFSTSLPKEVGFIVYFKLYGFKKQCYSYM